MSLTPDQRNLADFVRKETKGDLDAKIAERQSMFEKHLQYDDAELILLKGHLILEQTLNESLLLFFNDEEKLDRLRLMFDKKLTLLVALRGEGPMEPVLHDLKEINRIRNKLAHHLDFEDYHDDLKKWICSVLKIKKENISEDLEYRKHLASAFSHVIVVLDCLYTIQKRGFLKI